MVEPNMVIVGFDPSPSCEEHMTQIYPNSLSACSAVYTTIILDFMLQPVLGDISSKKT